MGTPAGVWATPCRSFKQSTLGNQNDTRALPAGDFDSDGVESADGSVERAGAQHVDPGTPARTTSARSAVGT
jgi:hypothetical protein